MISFIYNALGRLSIFPCRNQHVTNTFSYSYFLIQHGNYKFIKPRLLIDTEIKEWIYTSIYEYIQKTSNTQKHILIHI